MAATVITPSAINATNASGDGVFEWSAANEKGRTFLDPPSGLAEPLDGAVVVEAGETAVADDGLVVEDGADELAGS